MLTLRSLSAGRGAVAVFMILALMGLAGCKGRMVPPCPVVRVDSTTAVLTKFKEGPGRDVTDIAYEADIVGFKGECKYSSDEVEVTFNVDFTLTGGAAAQGGQDTLYYFVAIPQFFPDENGKRVMSVARKLPARPSQRETFTESNVRVKIPLQKDQAGAAFDIYIGFQLDNAQLEYNRNRAAR